MKNTPSKGKQYVLKSLLPALILSAGVIIAVSPLSCKVSDEGIQLLTGDFTVPHIETVTICDEAELSILFTKPIVSIDAVVSYQDDDSAETSFATQGSFTNENKTVLLTFAERTTVGQPYVVSGTVSDANGNTLSFKLPFTGYNADVPRLLLSEVRTEHKTSSNTSVTKHKFEYIELYVIHGGNLAGIELVSANDSESKKYCFPAINVQAGEYIVVHLRSPNVDSSDELEDNLALSTAADSCSTARDLWGTGTSPCLGKNDVILVRDKNNNTLLDAALFKEDTSIPWKNTFASFLSEVEKAESWSDGSGNISTAPEHAAVSKGLTTTRTLSRQNIPSLAAKYEQTGEVPKDDASQWFVVDTSEATPGLPNSAKKWVNKQ